MLQKFTVLKTVFIALLLVAMNWLFLVSPLLHEHEQHEQIGYYAGEHHDCASCHVLLQSFDYDISIPETFVIIKSMFHFEHQQSAYQFHSSIRHFLFGLKSPPIHIK